MPKKPPRAYTEEEIREKFLNHVRSCITYCENESRRETTKDKLELLAFCILSAIDGSSTDCPGFKMTPHCHPSDYQYHIDRGENYYPIDGSVDIAGGLHEHLYKKEIKNASSN